MLEGDEVDDEFLQEWFIFANEGAVGLDWFLCMGVGHGDDSFVF